MSWSKQIIGGAIAGVFGTIVGGIVLFGMQQYTPQAPKENHPVTPIINKPQVGQKSGSASNEEKTEVAKAEGQEQVVMVEERSVNTQAVPDAVRQSGNILLRDKQSVELHSAKAKISVIFNSFSGKEFAKLTIYPLGGKPLSLPIYNQGQYLEFESKTGSHVAVVLSVDFGEKNIEVDVSKNN